MGIRLLEGRFFNSADVADRPRVVIINEATARRFWPNESAIGKRMGGASQDPNWRVVVGVVGDVSHPADLDGYYTRFQSYRPLAQEPFGFNQISLRTQVAPEALASALRRAVAQVDPALPVHQIHTARALITRRLGNFSLLGFLLGTFAVLGLVLAAIGIYGVISYSVIQRTGEIGIRLALGAQATDVLRLLMGKGARLILLGSMLGFGGAYAVARFLASAIPTLPTRDPLAMGAIAFVILIVALVACYLPARRATKVDPMVAIRHE
jgi:putative ABC transport system permease protein